MSNDTQFQDFKKEVEKLREIDGAEEYAKQLAHLFFGNGLSLQTILLMAIEFGQQHPAWVSVEDELPTEVGRYWCCDDDNQQGELNWDGNSWRGEIDTYAVEGITHWMPMPTPPVKKGGEE